ncbi:MAG: hypothetical protein R3B68_04265 [Phycisphaerales bacterium]
MEFWELDWLDRQMADDELDDPDAWRPWRPSMRLDVATRDRLIWGVVIDDWDPETQANSEDGNALTEDMPFCTEAPIVSPKLRALIETHAPGCAQFLPIRMTYRGEPMAGGPCFVLNVIQVVDCLDIEPSAATPYPEHLAVHLRADHVQLDRDRVRFLSTRVPADAHLFRLRYDYITVVASDVLKHRLLREGARGVVFRRLPFRVENRHRTAP